MSSRVNTRKEIRRTVRVQEALNQLERSSAVSSRQETEVITHRCRVFRLNSNAIREGTSVYTIVWDTLEHPFKSGALPKGEVYFATSGSSSDAVGKEIESFCRRLGRVVISDWHSAGSV